MLRTACLALAAALLSACAHAPDGRVDRSETQIVRDAANVVIHALPESGNREWGYGWGAVSTRISRFVHWHIAAPEPADRPPDAITRRNGWIAGPGMEVGVTVFGDDDKVTMLSIAYDEFTNLDLVDALGDLGALVSFQADYESYSEYVVTPPDREPGLLTLKRICTPEGSRAARRCHNEAELTFEVE